MIAPRRVRVCQHVPFEGLGSIGTWLETCGADVGCTRLYAGDPLPPADEVELLVALGGPMSVNDETAFPWDSRFSRVGKRIAPGVMQPDIRLGFD